MACVPRLEVPTITAIECCSDAACPVGWRCSVSHGRWVHGVANQVQSVSVAPVAGSLDVVELDLR